MQLLRCRTIALVAVVGSFLYCALAALPPGSSRDGVAGVLATVAPAQAEAAQFGIDWSNQRVWVKTSTAEILRYGVGRIFTSQCYAAVVRIAPKHLVGVVVIYAGYRACNAGAAMLNDLARRYNRGLWASVGRHGSSWAAQAGTF